MNIRARKGIKTKKFRVEKSLRVRILQTIFGTLIACIYLFPLYWLAINSLKTDYEIFDTITFWPQNLTFAAWDYQLNDIFFLSSLKNSFLVSICTMGIATVLAIPAAYALGRYKMKGRSMFLFSFLITQMMPASLLLTPLYLTFSKMGLLNNTISTSMAIATISIPFVIITMRPYFMQIPASLDEAAKIDGCNAFTSFLRIMVPAVRSCIITVLCFSFLHGWGDLVYSMTFNLDEAKRPLTANIYKYLNAYGVKWNFIMAYGMILVIPILLIFLFFQRYIVAGLMAGAVKE